MPRRIGGCTRMGIIAGGLLALFTWMDDHAWAGPHAGTPDPSSRMLTFDGIANLELQPVEECSSLFPAIMADLTGPTTIEVMPERVKKVREAAIRSMNLAGGGGTSDPAGSFFDISIMLDPTRDSFWQVRIPEPGPSESFFDVFFILDLPDPNGNMLMLRSKVPVHLMAMTGRPPNPNQESFPLLEARFESNQPVDFFRLTQGNAYPPNPCMKLKQMSFVPVNPSAAIIKRELIQIEKKLDQLLRSSNPPGLPPTDGQNN